jgi:predicted enzyme related to lactoylglutathione lyase
MDHRMTLGVTLRVRSLPRSRALYRRLGFAETAVDEVGVARLRRGDVVVVLTDRTPATAGPQREEVAAEGRRDAGIVFTVVVTDIDDVLAYWQEEGMLVVTPMHRGRAGRVFHGRDHDGYEFRIEESLPR